LLYQRLIVESGRHCPQSEKHRLGCERCDDPEA